VAPLHLGVPAVDRFASLRPGHVLECVGAASCGKTRLLVQAAVTCILPPTHGGVRYGGNAGAVAALVLFSLRAVTLSCRVFLSPAGGVLFLDLDGRLDAARLPVALSQRLAACRAAAGLSSGLTCAAPDGTPLCDPQDPVYASSLARFRLLRCRSSAEVVHIAAVLDRLVAKQAPVGRRSSHVADVDVPEVEEVAPTRLLLIDNLGAHYWQEKATRPVHVPHNAALAAFNDAPGGGSAPGPAILDARTVHGALASAVRAAAMRHRVVVIATRHSYGSPAPPPQQPAGQGDARGGGIPGPVYREYMSRSWQQVVTHRLSLFQSDPSGAKIDTHWVAPQQQPGGELLGTE
jgi:DNA-repair protein XRCC2